MSRRPLVVVGDALLDRDVDGSVARLCPEAPVPVLDETVQRTRPGGAALAATLASADGRPVTLVTALARDAGGVELAGLLRGSGVSVLDLELQGPTPEKVRLRDGGRLLLRLDRGGRHPSSAGSPPEAVRDVLRAAAAIVVADYGRGVAGQPELLAALTAAAGSVPIVWDPHPRGGDPVPGAALATPNRAEAKRLVPEIDGNSLRAEAARAARLRERWAARGVAVTAGANGALLDTGGSSPVVVPAPPVVGGDPCGAGDRFATAAAALLAAGASLSEAVEGAVASASAFVASGGAGSLEPEPSSSADATEAVPPHAAVALARRVRAAGGTVVATGGCFDLLHAGHVSTLEAARSLGDCLIVCLNSDASVRRLKGADRPLVPQEDRAALLRALGCVDAVAVFDEPTPEALLECLRPHVWAKGGDYALDDLPEASLLGRWDGQAVILPYIAGRSTTRLLEEVAHRGGR